MIQDHRYRKPGVYASPRQPQGDFGRGKDHAPLGSSDDVNRELNQRGAYRDAEQAPDKRAPAQEAHRPATDRPDKKSPAGPPSSKGKVENDHNKVGNKAATQLNQGRRTPQSRSDRETHGPGPHHPGSDRTAGNAGGGARGAG